MPRELSPKGAHLMIYVLAFFFYCSSIKISSACSAFKLFSVNSDGLMFIYTNRIVRICDVSMCVHTWCQCACRHLCNYTYSCTCTLKHVCCAVCVCVWRGGGVKGHTYTCTCICICGLYNYLMCVSVCVCSHACTLCVCVCTHTCWICVSYIVCTGNKDFICVSHVRTM